MSAMGISQIAAVMGPCVAGGAYLPIMSDETLMVEEHSSIFLAGPYLVKAAIGENTDNETLGGAAMHTEISGIADYKFKTEEECLDRVKNIISKIGDSPKAGFSRIAAIAPAKNVSEVYQFFPEGNLRPYDMHDIIDTIVDAGSFDEFKDEYGKTLLCGYARVDGWAVGIVANQRLNIKNKKGELQIGGVLYNDSADKGARFIMNCNQKKIPLVFLQDITGFMVGTRSEHSGIIKDGAKMVNAVANSVVPKLTFILGNSYGAGNYAMCGKAYDPRFIYGWPSAKIAVMGGDQAAKTLWQIESASLKAKGKEITPEHEAKFLKITTDKYAAQTTAVYAASRLWIDAIIDPKETRLIISENLSAANCQPEIESFKTGVIQV